MLAELWDSAQKLCLELGQLTGSQTRAHTGPRTIWQLWMQRQQDTPNTANIDYSDDILCGGLQTAHKSLNVF